MGSFMNSVFALASLFIIVLGLFLLKHKKRQENLANYLKIVAVLCVLLGVTGLLFIGLLEFF